MARRIIGLTGGIASGKTTVARLLAEAGCRIVDADVLAREVVEPGTPGFAQVLARFPGVLTREGRLDRQELGRQVFENDIARHDLEAIVHPLVRYRLDEALAQDLDDILVLVVPLLFEAGMESLVQEIWVVSATSEKQIERLRLRDGLTRSDALQRLAAQWPLGRKEALAHRVIRNNTSLAELESQVRALVSELRHEG